MKSYFVSGVTALVLLSCCGLFAPAQCAVTINYVGYCPVVCPTATCPDSDYVIFNLFTRSNPTARQVIDLNANNLTSSNFVASKPTKIIIHGLNCSASDWHIAAMRDAFLTNGDYNVILVDYAFLAQGGGLLCYATATINAKHVGACTGGLVTALRQAGASDIHVIGHSLGAQVAGHTGKAVLPNLLPRITGLDPADWSFTFDFAGRLQPSLASFVDVIHTSLPNVVTSGHVDYYVNGGFSQPGCLLWDPNNNFIFCSHWRAAVYFTESINSATGFYGWACPIESAPIGGICLFHGGRTILMGNSASTSTRGVVQVPTNNAAPWAMGKS